MDAKLQEKYKKLCFW